MKVAEKDAEGRQQPQELVAVGLELVQKQAGTVADLFEPAAQRALELRGWALRFHRLTATSSGFSLDFLDSRQIPVGERLNRRAGRFEVCDLFLELGPPRGGEWK